MMSYKDMTWCTREDCPMWNECKRALTKEVKKEADEFGLPCFSMMRPNNSIESLPCMLFIKK